MRVMNPNQLPKDRFMEFIQQQKLSVASNGVLYRTDKVGIIPEILNVWFDKRVQYKNEMKKFGKKVTMRSINSFKDS